MQAYITTTGLVGEKHGTIFRDVSLRKADGTIVVGTDSDGAQSMDSIAREDQLDLKHPIREIIVNRRQVVDGLTITYQLTDNRALTKTHGYKPTDQKNAHPVPLGSTERIVGVFGSNGYHAEYGRNIFLSIGFVIYDSAKREGNTRVVDPFSSHVNPMSGADEMINADTVTRFYASDVVAFGGFHTVGSSQDAGLDGLFFYKNISAQ
ncbi:hypothetical protein C8Q70DRAFT_930446 [Cubamyces menziesii]|uniref:Uncharacterized protein n=1 Tax=Trametes cubensis TaxID=1111947 RepID=A0AAD7U290_9APHY|nr:hypothetical protein C8Q70DRAFT_930446 [Cubamyces menziesii]KAJ8496032.1 hypothetical protein ONZ51_g1319 [Trametes cubensis]